LTVNAGRRPPGVVDESRLSLPEQLQALGVVSVWTLAIWGISIGLHLYAWRFLIFLLVFTLMIPVAFLHLGRYYRYPLCWTALLLPIAAVWFSPVGDHFSNRLLKQSGPSNSDIIAFRRTRANLQSLFVIALSQDDTKKPMVSGSAVVVRRIGNTCFVMTAQHVVEGVDRSRLPILVLDRDWNGDWKALGIRLKGMAKTDMYSPVVYQHPSQDWALLAMRDSSSQAVAAPLADRRLGNGECVLAIGNPGGQPFHDDGKILGTLTGKGADHYRHDALIDGGSSGGPLYDRTFHLAGINIGRFSRTILNNEDAVAVPASVLDGLRLGAADVKADQGAGAKGTWTDLGVAVDTGETLHASARGWWRYQGGDARSSECDAGGAGEKDEGGKERRLFKNYPLGALVVGIRSPGKAVPTVLGTFDDARPDTFVLKDGGIRVTSFQATLSGDLVARINDADNGDGANQGLIELAVVVSK
jgi:hypothetical protein